MWSLFDEENGAKRELKPKVFSSGKTQADVVDEVVRALKKGSKILFIHGVCGSGKSAVALNIAKELGRASIVVPIKNLQRQYENDYMLKKFLLKNNGQKLKISMLTGRNNHLCPYLAENKTQISEPKKEEKNSTLYDIFIQPKTIKPKYNAENDKSCDNPFIPCKIEIKSKNLHMLKKYHSENPDKQQNAGAELDLKTMKRFAIAPACPYWCPVLPSDKKLHNDWIKKNYKAVGGEYSFYQRENGCPYYQQFNSYLNSDVIIFNSDHYILETAIGRKPLTDVEIIDECDEFLDSFALEGTINLNRLRNELSNCIFSEQSEKQAVDSIINDLADINQESGKFLGQKDNILPLKGSKVSELIKALAKSDLMEVMAEDSYLEHCVETARKFYELISDSYINFYRDENKKEIFVKLVTINLDKLLGSLIEKNKAFVFMSGTLHSERVLKEIFGLKDFKIVDAETFNQGTITKQKTGLEKDFSFDSFQKNRVTREDYLRAFDKCIEIAKLPAVVQVSAFNDLPNESEIETYNLKNLTSSSALMEQQNKDKEGKIVKDFKLGKTKILFTTRCSRGIDFPFETCNSVIISKFPYPNTQSLFWKIMKKQKPAMFWDFYRDKAHRELLQRVYRSVRASDDHVFLLSPDIRVLNSRVI